jgi:hypothetical protein
MRQVPGVDHERLECLYLLASAKAQVAAAEQLLREAVSNMQVAETRGANEVYAEAIRAVVALREKVFQLLEDAP